MELSHLKARRSFILLIIRYFEPFVDVTPADGVSCALVIFRTGQVHESGEQHC
jgi:hypothetical protein